MHAKRSERPGRARQSRKEAEERLQFQARLLDAVEEGVVAVDLEGKITYWNRYAEKLFGWPAAEALGRDGLEVAVPFGLTGQGAEIIKKVLGGEVWTGEFVLQRRDGSTFPAQVTDAPIRAADGRIIGIAHEITARKRSDEQLRRVALQLADAQRVAHIGSWEWDIAADAVSWSDEKYRIMGLEPQEVPATFAFFRSCVHPADRQRVNETIQQAARDHQPFSYDFRAVLPKSGETRVHHVEGTVITDENGRAVRMFGTLRDITESRAAEASVRESENRFHSIFDQAIVGIAETDLSSRFLNVNDCYCRTLGYSREELLQLRMHDVTHPDDLAGNVVKLRALLGGGPDFQVEKRYRGKDGSLIWVINRVNGIRDAAGKLQSVVAISLDITERKRSEEALQRSEERFRRYFELGLIGMATSSPAKGWIEVNDEICRILGYEESELLAMTWDQLTHPDDLATDIARFNRAMAGEIDGYSMGKRFIRKDGRVIDTTISVKCLRHADGSIDHFVALLQDVTERKEAEKALRESEERFRQLAENINQIFWLMRADGACLHYVSKAYEQIWGRSCESMYADPTSWMEAIHPDDRERIAENEQSCTIGCGEHDRVYRIIRPDGSVRWIHGRAFPVRDESGKLIRIAGIAEDITERKEAEQHIERLAESFQALSRRLLDVQEEERRHLARELHDEISQTLVAAKLNLRMIAPDVPAAAIGRIEDSICLLDRLLQQARQLSLDLRPPLLDELGLVPALRWLADQQAQRARLRVTFTTNVERLEMDPFVRTACFRVAQEAITNSIRHAQPMTVAVEVRAEPDRVWLAVQDDGVGFDYDARRQGAAQGATIGLLSMKERALLVRGGLEVHTAPGRGTKICAWFPLALPKSSTTELA